MKKIIGVISDTHGLLRPKVLEVFKGCELIIHAGDIQLIIMGHSHKPGKEKKDGVLYVNPGSAGPRRFKLPISVALIEIDEKELYVRFIDL